MHIAQLMSLCQCLQFANRQTNFKCKQTQWICLTEISASFVVLFVCLTRCKFNVKWTRRNYANFEVALTRILTRIRSRKPQRRMNRTRAKLSENCVKETKGGNEAKRAEDTSNWNWNWNCFTKKRRIYAYVIKNKERQQWESQGETGKRGKCHQTKWSSMDSNLTFD